MKEGIKMDKKRKWVIRFAIIFVIALALLTFFSQTIMNYSLTKVTAQYPDWSTIATSTRAQGNATPMVSLELKAIDNRKISGVHAYNYSEVRAGDVLFTLEPIESSDELDELKRQLEEIELERYYESLLPNHGNDYTMYEEAIEAANLMVEAAQTDLNNARNKNSIIQSAQADIHSAQTRLISLETEKEGLVLAKGNLEYELQVAIDNLEAVPEDEDNSAEQAEVDRLIDAISSIDARIQSKATEEVQVQTRLDNAMARLAEAEGFVSVSEAERQLTQAQRSLTDARRALSDQLAIDNVQDQRDRRAREQEDEIIDELKDRIEELEYLLEQNEIRAPISGLVFDLYLSVGDEIAIDQVVCIIMDPMSGYKADFVFTKEEVRYIYEGSRLNSSDYYVDEVVVMQIRPNPQDPINSSIVTTSVSGELYPDAQISVWFDDYSQHYEAVVPNSAIHQDDTGSFVYVLQIKDGPLGERFYAQKTPVTILATDGRRSAIDPEVVRGRQIIMRSEKPLENGEQIRLEDFRPEG